MKRRNTKSTINFIEIIENMESELSIQKRALKDVKPIVNGEKEEFTSILEYEFCGMWKDRDDMKGLSSTEWLAKIRREQWSRIQ